MVQFGRAALSKEVLLAFVPAFAHVADVATVPVIKMILVEFKRKLNDLWHALTCDVYHLQTRSSLHMHSRESAQTAAKVEVQKIKVTCRLIKKMVLWVRRTAERSESQNSSAVATLVKVQGFFGPYSL